MIRVRRIALATLAVGALLSASVAVSQPADRPPAQPGERRGEGRGEGREGGRQEGARGERQGPNVGGAMKSMGRAMERLEKQLADASKKDENLRLINDIQRGAVAAKGQPLPNDVLAKGKDEAEKTKMAQSYRKNLIALVRKTLDLEDAVLAGKGDDAKKLIDEIAKLRDSSHDALGLKDE